MQGELLYLVCVYCACVFVVWVKMRKRGELGEKVQIAGGACPFYLNVAAQVSVQA